MVSESKSALRKSMLEKRDSVSESELTEKSAEIGKRLFELEEFKNARTVCFYLSKGSEVQTKNMIIRAMDKGKKIVVPITGKEIELVTFTSFDGLVPAKFGVLEPRVKHIVTRVPEVVIVPGVAFDSDLHRIGYGKGYYDSFLSKIKTIKIGICFDFQIIDKIPKHEHDQKLDIIVTEKRVIRC